MTDLPAHSVRVSTRAKRARLVVTAAEGLVVVVPRGFPVRRVPELLRTHAAWVERALARTAERRGHLDALADSPLPERIELPGVGLLWTVDARATASAGVRGRLSGDTLVLSGNVSDRAACHAAMRRAVARAASERLPLQLGGVELETGWSASKVSVRRQRTRWGSCSARGAISLNESLAYLPARLVRYVLVHELAHTRRLDHSPAFWRLVEVHDACWRDARRELREAWRHIPAWADPGR
jgi:predicted metal-dependent hydrolase